MHICFQKVHNCDANIAYLDEIAKLEILPYGLHFSEVMPFTKLSKMFMGNIMFLAATSKWCHYQSASILENPCKMNLIDL